MPNRRAEIEHILNHDLLLVCRLRVTIWMSSVPKPLDCVSTKMTCVPTCSLILDWKGDYRHLSEIREGDFVHNPLDQSRPSRIVYISHQHTCGIYDLFQYGAFRGVAEQKILLNKKWIQLSTLSSPCTQLCQSLTNIVVHNGSPVNIDGATVATLDYTFSVVPRIA